MTNEFDQIDDYTFQNITQLLDFNDLQQVKHVSHRFHEQVVNETERRKNMYNIYDYLSDAITCHNDNILSYGLKYIGLKTCQDNVDALFDKLMEVYYHRQTQEQFNIKVCHLLKLFQFMVPEALVKDTDKPYCFFPSNKRCTDWFYVKRWVNATDDIFIKPIINDDEYECGIIGIGTACYTYFAMNIKN